MVEGGEKMRGGGARGKERSDGNWGSIRKERRKTQKARSPDLEKVTKRKTPKRER